MNNKTQTTELEQSIRDWFLNELGGDPSLIDRMSEADLDRALAAFGIDTSVLVLSERRLKSVLEPIMSKTQTTTAAVRVRCNYWFADAARAPCNYPECECAPAVDMTETTEREPCDRASLVVKRAENCGWLRFISPHGRDQLLATIRIALDTEVKAGGAFTILSEIEIGSEGAL